MADDLLHAAMRRLHRRLYEDPPLFREDDACELSERLEELRAAVAQGTPIACRRCTALVQIIALPLGGFQWGCRRPDPPIPRADG